MMKMQTSGTAELLDMSDYVLSQASMALCWVQCIGTI